MVNGYRRQHRIWPVLVQNLKHNFSGQTKKFKTSDKYANPQWRLVDFADDRIRPAETIDTRCRYDVRERTI